MLTSVLQVVAGVAVGFLKCSLWLLVCYVVSNVFFMVVVGVLLGCSEWLLMWCYALTHESLVVARVLLCGF